MVTDGLASHFPALRSGHAHQGIVDAKGKLPDAHRVAALCKRWLLGTHQDSVEPKHLQGYLNELVYRFSRRTSRHHGLPIPWPMRLAINHEPVRYHELVAELRPGKKPPLPPGSYGHPPKVERPPAGRP